jgi:hypothetical protein
MPSLSKTLGLLALAGTIVPPALFMFKIMPLETVKMIMLVSTIVWFATAPFWLKTDEN